MSTSPRDDGFTVIEAMVAVSVLAVALALTIQPVMAALRRVSDARVILVAENLAQAEVESLRALDYEDVGLPGRTPAGVLTPERQVDVEGRVYTVALDVTYAGSLTGVDVIPQGGDGVEGAWDPGVDYKVAVVTVTAEGREHDPIVMETIVAPRTIGAHEGIANARIYLAAYEPFLPGEFRLPTLQVQAPPSGPITSNLRADVQVFPAIPAGDYTVSLAVADGWLIHPDDVLAGADRLEVRAGHLVETVLRVYRPATLRVVVIDDATGAAISNARLSYKNLPRNQSTTLVAGEYTATGLIPDAYDLTVTASGYQDWTLRSVNVPANYPDPVHEITVRMVSQSVVTTTTTTTTVPATTTTTTVPGATTTTTVPGATTTTTVAATTTTMALGPAREVRFTVTDATGRAIAGATVTVPHPTRGTIVAGTDEDGRAYINLEQRYGYTATASTSWGHGSASASFDPADTTRVDLTLTRPAGKGLMGMLGGRKAEFLYRAQGAGTWIVMPPNADDEASFVGSPGTFEVAKRCTKDGKVVDQRTVTVAYNENRSVDLKSKCK